MIAAIRSERGITAAEVLVTSAVIGLVMAGLFSLLMTGQQSFATGAGRAEAQQNARLVISQMVQEIRTAGFDPLNTQSFAAVTALASGTGFILRNDWDGSGTINTAITQSVDGVTHGEQITYTFTGTTLTRQETGVDAAAVTVTAAVSSVTLTYRDADDTVVTAASAAGAGATSVRSVEISVVTTPDTTVAGTANAVTVNSWHRVRIRNR